jgi:hypothetical protein
VTPSAVDCIQPAIQHTKQQLFASFRWGQWLRLALVGILAGELHVGSCNLGNLPQMLAESRRGSSREFLLPTLPHLDPARIAQFAGLIAVIVLMAIVFFFVFLYLNSVFRFILFESVIRRQCSIGNGWERWHPTGRRYFLWQLVFIISTWIFLGLLIGIPLMFMGGAGWFQNSSAHAGGMLGSIFLLLGIFLVVALLLAVVQILAKDFLVPVMALEGVDFAEGWSRLFAMMRPELGKYAVYVLMKIVLSIAAAILFGIAAIIPVLVVVIPCVLIVLAAVWSGAGWNVATISAAIIFGSIAIAVLVYLIALVSVPGTIFFPAYALYFFAGRYPNLASLLTPAPPEPAAPAAPEAPGSPPEPPPLPPSPEPMG